MGLFYYLGEVHYHLKHTNLFLVVLIAVCLALTVAFWYLGDDEKER